MHGKSSSQSSGCQILSFPSRALSQVWTHHHIRFLYCVFSCIYMCLCAYYGATRTRPRAHNRFRHTYAQFLGRNPCKHGRFHLSSIRVQISFPDRSAAAEPFFDCGGSRGGDIHHTSTAGMYMYIYAYMYTYYACISIYKVKSIYHTCNACVFMYMYVYIYTHMYVYMYVYTYVHMYVCMYVCIYSQRITDLTAQTQTCINIYMHAYIHTYIHYALF
jgi:hypothetical protein